MTQFFITSTLPTNITEEFVALIPEQRALADELVKSGVLASYSLAADRSKLWLVINAENEKDAMDVLSEFPLARFMDFDIEELAFHLSSKLVLPALSLN